MGWIINQSSIRQRAVEKWTHWNKKIIEQAKLESNLNTRLCQTMEEIDFDGKGQYA